MEKQYIEVSKSYGRCLMHDDFFTHFYEIFMNSDPFIKEKFSKTDFTEQTRLVRHGVNLMILFARGNSSAQNGLMRLRETHSYSQINIPPKYYIAWKESLLKTVEKYDAEFSPILKAEWSEMLQIGIDYISGGYDMSESDLVFTVI